jgi:hypothetical protein
MDVIVLGWAFHTAINNAKSPFVFFPFSFIYIYIYIYIYIKASEFYLFYFILPFKCSFQSLLFKSFSASLCGEVL